MEKPPLYPDCDFAIWFRSVNENNITEQPIEGRITGKNSSISFTFLILLFSKKELFPSGLMVVCIKMVLVYLM